MNILLIPCQISMQLSTRIQRCFLVMIETLKDKENTRLTHNLRLLWWTLDVLIDTERTTFYDNIQKLLLIKNLGSCF